MEDCKDWLIFVFEGVCWVCGLGDVCCVLVGSWGWCDVVDGASEELVDAAGVLCQQGSEL